MTYANLILPYDPTEQEVTTSPKEKLSLKGKLTSALKKAGAGVKKAVKNPGKAMKTLGKYMQQNEDKILNKFSGIAVAQVLSTGKVTVLVLYPVICPLLAVILSTTVNEPP